MKTVRNPEAYNSAISQYYDGLSVAVPRSSYINRLTAGMQAKKYKGGQAARVKAQTSRLFESYFKPLPQ